MRAGTMPIPVLHRCGVVGIGVAVVAEVRACVVLADVFRHNATTSLALSAVLVILVQYPPARRIGEHIWLHVTRADEIHQHTVMVEALHDQPVIHTAIVLYPIAVKILQLAARAGRDAPALHKLADASGHLLHLVGRELARGNSAALQVLVNLSIRLDIDKAEHKTRCQRCEFVA